MTGFSRFRAAVVCAALLVPAQAGAAEIVEFDVSGQGGAGGSLTLGGLDWAPGNALAVGAQPLLDGVPRTFTTYYQSTLTSFLDPAGNPISGTGLGTDFQITVQAAIPEIGELNGNSIVFGHDPNGAENFLNLYFHDAVVADARTGIGFDEGTLILQAVFTGNDTVFSVTQQGLALLDPTGASGILSVIGGGSGPIFGEVAWTDDAFFVGDDLDTFILETVQSTPFTLVEPTAIGPQPAGPGGGVVGNIPNFIGDPQLAIPGAPVINGVPLEGCLGDVACDVLLQSDTRLVFAEVPEPAGIAFVAGLAALAFAAARGRPCRAEATAQAWPRLSI